MRILATLSFLMLMLVSQFARGQCPPFMPIVQSHPATCFGAQDGRVTVTAVGAANNTLKFVLALPDPNVPDDFSRARGIDSAIAVGQWTFRNLLAQTPTTPFFRRYIWIVKDANTNRVCVVNTGSANVNTWGTVDVFQPYVVVQTQRPTCTNERTGSITIAVQNGQLSGYRFTLLDLNLNVIESIPIRNQAVAQYTFRNLIGGRTYNYRIEDLNDAACVRSDRVALGEHDPITLSQSVNPIINPGCVGANNASINPIISGGVQFRTNPFNLDQAYRYFWSKGNDPSPFTTTRVLTNITADIYKLVVRDSLGCDTSFIFDVRNPRPLTIQLQNPDRPGDFNARNVICNNGTDRGKVRVVALGGRGQKITVAGFPQAAFPDAGKYFQLERNGRILFPATFVPVDNPAINTYSQRDTVRTTYLYEGLQAGDYTVKVWDVTNEIDIDTELPARNIECFTSTTFSILEPAPIIINTAIDSLRCYHSSDANIYLSVSGGVPPYTYQWSLLDINGTPIVTKDLRGVSAGTYMVTVRDATDGCATSTAINVPFPGTGLPLTAFVQSIKHPSCPGASDGEVVLGATGGTRRNLATPTLVPRFSYTFELYDSDWNLVGRRHPNSPHNTFIGLRAGNYHAVVTDDKGCKDTTNMSQPFSMVAPTNNSITLQPGRNTDIVLVERDNANSLNENFRLTKTNIGCHGGNEAALALNRGGVDAPLVNLRPKVFNNAPASSIPAQILPFLELSDLFDANRDGIVDLRDDLNNDTRVNLEDFDLDGDGIPNGLQTIQDLINYYNAAGVQYMIPVGIDGNPTPAPSQLFAYRLSRGGVNPSNRHVTGQTYYVLADEFGNTPPRPFSSRVYIQPQVEFDTLIAGDYRVQVSSRRLNTVTGTLEEDSCFTFLYFNLEQPAAPLQALMYADSAECFQDGYFIGGRMRAVVTGGTPPYTYSWSLASGTPVDVPTNPVQDRNLTPDQRWLLQVTDANMCEVRAINNRIRSAPPGSNPDAIYEIAPVGPEQSLKVRIIRIAQVRCNPSNNGQRQGSEGELRAIVTGGTRPYRYFWNHLGVQANQDSAYNRLTPNMIYSVEVIDARGCSTRDRANRPDTICTTTLCNRGVLGVDYRLADQPEIVANPGEFILPGNMLMAPPQIVVIPGVILPTFDCQSPTGSFSFSFNGGTGLPQQFSLRLNGQLILLNGRASNVPSQYQVTPEAWTSTTGSATISSLPAGRHNIELIDANGCSTRYDFEIGTRSPQITGVLYDTDLLSNTPAANVRGRDTVTCHGANDGAIRITNIIGNQNQNPNPANTSQLDRYYFVWRNSRGQTIAQGVGLAANHISNLSPDVYNLEVTEIKNDTIVPPGPAQCKFVTTRVIHDRPLLTGTFTSTRVSCFNQTNGSITGTITGGIPPYRFRIGNSGPFTAVVGNTFTVSNLAANKYNVNVLDANSCAILRQVEVTQPDPIRTFVDYGRGQFRNVSCNGANDGRVRVFVRRSAATLPITFEWTNLTTGERIDTETKSALSDTATGLAPGRYSVKTTDANGCSHTEFFTISEPAVLAFKPAIVENSPRCNEKLGSIRVEVTGGRRPYYYRLFDAATNNLVDSGSVNSYIKFPAKSGTYFAIATDSSDDSRVTDPDLVRIPCQARLDNIVVLDPAPPVVEIDRSTFRNVSCRGGNNGRARANASGGGGTNPTFSFEWRRLQFPNVVFNTIREPQNLFAGQYELTAINQLTNCRSSITVTISEPDDSLRINPVVTNPNCNGGNNGIIASNISGGTPPYSFAWRVRSAIENNGILIPGTERSPTITNLSPAVYSVEARDANGCTVFRNDIIVREPDPIRTRNILSRNVTCFEGNDGRLDLRIIGGVPPYNVAWRLNGTVLPNRALSNVEPDQIISIQNLTAGTYRYEITDQVGCLYFEDQIVTQPNRLVGAISKIDIGCPGIGNDGRATVTITGGTPPYRVNWSMTTSTATSVMGLAPGTYFVNITDNNGCTSTTTFSIENRPLTATLTPQNVRCFQTDDNSKDGAIIATTTGGVPPYTFTVTKVGTTAALTRVLSSVNNTYITDQNLTEGLYEVRVRDARTPVACEVAPQTVEIKMASTRLAATLEVIRGTTCRSTADGAARVNVTGGVSPYNYLWTSEETTPNATRLPAGQNTVTIIDGYGCRIIRQLNIAQPDEELVVAARVSNVTTCGGNDGAITLDVRGGVIPYEFNWSNGATTQNIAGLTSGTYTGTLTDANGCVKVATLSIAEPPAVTVAPPVVTSPTCNGGSNGSINLTITGGTPPFTFSWSNGATSEDLTNIGAGTYVGRIVDRNNCRFEATITVTQPVEINAQAASNRIDCGANNGAINLTVSGENAPFTFIWSNGATTQNVNGLEADIYTVTITDRIGCTRTLDSEIDINSDLRLNPIVTNISCNGQTDGIIEINRTGGVPPFRILWSNGDTLDIINNLPRGTYTVTVTDANNCRRRRTFNISEPAVLTISNVVQRDVTCGGANNGSIDITIVGGTPPYTYRWSNESTREDLVNIAGGTYSGTITDARGCQTQGTVTINEPLPITVSERITPAGCIAGNNGSIVLNVEGGIPPYTFRWTGDFTTKDLVNLSPGTYSVTVTDQTNCTFGRSYQMTLDNNITPPAITIQGDTNLCGNQTVFLLAAPGYDSYFWSNGSTDQGIVVQNAGSYFVTVRNKCGQVNSRTVVVRRGAVPPTPEVTGPGNNCIISSSITTGNYRFQWFKGDTLLSGATQTTYRVVERGRYSIEITDRNTGCKSRSAARIIDPATCKFDSRVLSAETSPLSLYPNPAASVVTLQGSWSAGQNVKISVFNAVGQEVLTEHTRTLRDAQGLTVNIESIATGIYTIKVVADDKVWSGKVVKQ